MQVRGRRRKSIVFFIVLGACLVALAVALNVGWILLNWREVALLVLGIIFFVVIIIGVVLNTIFLIREIRRNEQHDAFINAVTHELKTPIASMRLYLETLKTRPVDHAVKYSDKHVNVFVDVAAPDKNIVVRIMDEGIGIPAGQLKRIFNRFHRAPGRFMARVKGTGLGLFIVRSIIKKHGGRVFAES